MGSTKTEQLRREDMRGKKSGWGKQSIEQKLSFAKIDSIYTTIQEICKGRYPEINWTEQNDSKKEKIILKKKIEEGGRRKERSTKKKMCSLQNHHNYRCKECEWHSLPRSLPPIC